MISPLPEVSVVCAWYNRADYIRDTVDSLLAQDFDSFEVIVVNDGSTDPRVKEIFDSYCDPRLRVLHQDNAGFVGAIKQAIEASNAPYIAIQGAGDVSYPSRISKQYDFLSKHPEHALVGCEYYNVVIDSKGAGRKKHVEPRNHNPTAKDICRGNPFGHGEVMFKRSCYDKVGGYRDFFINSQDKDLWLRLSENYSLHILSEPIYERRIFTADGISSSLKKTLMQIAYSRIADVCLSERLSDRRDCVDEFGSVAMIKVPLDFKTSYRVALAVRQSSKFNSLDIQELKHVWSLYGFFNYALANVVRVICMFK